jgi:hypothetical protein
VADHAVTDNDDFHERGVLDVLGLRASPYVFWHLAKRLRK